MSSSLVINFDIYAAVSREFSGELVAVVEFPSIGRGGCAAVENAVKADGFVVLFDRSALSDVELVDAFFSRATA